MILLAVWTGENPSNYPFSGPNVNGPCKLQTLRNRKRIRIEPARLRTDSAYRTEVAIRLADLGRINIFVVVNGLFKPWPIDILVRRLNALWVDLDCYKQCVKPLDAWAHLEAIEFFETTGVPQPSIVLCSGCGLYLMWHLEGPSTHAFSRNVALFRECQARLAEKLEFLGADRAATNPARMLRAVGTAHPIGDVTVRQIAGCEEEYTPEEM
ncbi:MAG: hypothetical protein IH898_06695, partial [Planctomycetes bacterium]|nr:hypothetical protein [Planctomycetota bacterium]